MNKSTPNLDLGVDKWADCSKFEGQWEVNKISGLGVYSWIDDRQYKGDSKWIWQRKRYV